LTATDTYLTCPAGTEWFFYINDSYDPANTSPVITDDQSLFNNASDWSDVDAANGKVCFEVDTTSTALALKFTGASPANPSHLDMTAELWMQAPGESLSMVAQWDMIMKNIVSNGESTSGLVLTLSSSVRFDGNDVVLLFPDGNVAQRWSP
jgi:hypothetical protein